MIEATIAMLRARRDERVALAGVLVALFADDPTEAVRRLEAVADSARECTDATPQRERRKRAIYQGVERMARDMLAPVRQLAERAGP